jgi:hypothetical protein
MKISKSKFVAGVQCLKPLYPVVHQPQLVAQPNSADEAMIKQEISWITRPSVVSGCCEG